MKQNLYLIIGAGLSGLAAAMKIEKHGGSSVLIDAADTIGGKLKTELFEDNYLLDHGFQVLLPAYAELQKNIDLKALNLKYFKSGALIFNGTNKMRISDPLQDPSLLFETLFSSVGHVKDKWLIAKLRLSVLMTSDQKLLSQNLGTSVDFLRQFGFSDQMIENFWRPFFSGIFLESELQTEASFLKFLFKMFSQSPVAVPAEGIAELPKWMHAQLKSTDVLLNSRVSARSEKSITLETGKVLNGIVIDARPVETAKWGHVTTLYFSSPKSPIQGSWLFLNKRQTNSLVNHVAVMTEVSKSYSRNGNALISVNILRPQISSAEFAHVLTELQVFFGEEVRSWKFLKSFEIPHALPLYLSSQVQSAIRITPSQQGALQRGHQLALDASI